MQTFDLGQIGFIEIGILLDILRPNIGDVEESTGFRQIRRRFKWLDRCGRMDQHEVGVRLLRGVFQQSPQIAVITYAPRFRGAHGIQLRHPTPTLLFGNGFRQFDAGRCADQRRLAVQLTCVYA